MTMQQKLFIALAIIFVAAAVIGALSRGAARPTYRPRAIMTPNELEFFQRLRRALPEMCICPQVALHALIEPRACIPQRRQRDFWRISQKVIDYVVLSADLQVVAVIELDDRTHNRAKDAVRDSYLASAGIRTLRYESRAKPTEQQIRQHVMSLLKPPGEGAGHAVA